MSEKALELYKQVLEITKRGKDAEIRINKDGQLVVYEVKRKRAV